VSTHAEPRLTPARARALAILHPVHALDARLFAHYMWPTSSSWGARRPGRGVYLRARGFLARLEAEGLVVRDESPTPRYRLSPAGAQRALEEATGGRSRLSAAPRLPPAPASPRAPRSCA
jgi:hypothetical protein